MRNDRKLQGNSREARYARDYLTVQRRLHFSAHSDVCVACPDGVIRRVPAGEAMDTAQKQKVFSSKLMMLSLRAMMPLVGATRQMQWTRVLLSAPRGLPHP